MSKISETTKTLMAAKKLIKNEENWCQHVLARDKNGTPTSPTNISAHQFCARGALIHVKNISADWWNEILQEEKFLCAVARELRGTNYVHINNSSPHDKVLEMFDKAIALSMMEDQKV